LWQPLITKTNDHTSSKSLKLNIRWEVHKRTRQGVSAKLESYIYRIHMVRATSSYLPHFLLKATMLYTCVLTVMRCFGHGQFLFSFIFWLYKNIVFLFFSFRDDEEARDIAVTWHVTWCDVISLEPSGKI